MKSVQERMHLILCFILAIVSQSTRSEHNRHFISNENSSNETYFNWILHPPWKRHSDLFNDKLCNESADYFGIRQDDHITNESYIETSKLTVCNDIHVTFSSRVHYSSDKITLILFTYQCNIWKKEWEHMLNDSHWELHQLSINLTNQNEDIRLRFLPISHSSDPLSIDMTIPIITTHRNCLFNQTSSPPHRITSSTHLFLFVTFGSIFLLLFAAVMAAFIYVLISKQYNRWLQKRPSRLRRKGRKTTNVVGDESTVFGVETDTV